MANRRQFLGNLIKRLTGGALLPLAGGGAVSLADPAAAVARLPAAAVSMQTYWTRGALADFRLMSSSKFIGCSTGRSPGFAPFTSLSARPAARRQGPR
jgi:hypothetical protein